MRTLRLYTSVAFVTLLGLAPSFGQTPTKPTIEVGPSLDRARIAAPVVSVKPPALPAMPTPAPILAFPAGKPVSTSAQTSQLIASPPPTQFTNDPSGVRTTDFADPPVVTIPSDSKPARTPATPVAAPPASLPVLPMLGSVVGIAPSNSAPGNAAAPPSTTTPPLPVPSPAPVIGTEKATDKESDSSVKFKFSPGDEHMLNMESTNGLFKFMVGGRVQIDAVWVRAADNVQAPRALGGIGKADDAVNFRRARFDLAGEFYKNIDFRMQWDFINTTDAERSGVPLPVNTPVPTDLWVTFKNLPYLGNLRIGNQKPPISFEHLTSSRFLNFLERSLAFDAFVENQNNGFEPGISAFDTFAEERATWAIGVFKNTRSIFGWNVGDGEYDVTGRLTCLPIYENDGEILVHLGVGASHRDLDDHQDRIRARLLERNGPAVLHNIVAEVRMLGDARDQVVPEFVVVYGPWTLQSEYYHVWAYDATTPVTGAGARTNHGTVQFQGAYAEVLYFLTGEYRSYNRKAGAFGRVTPHDSFRGFANSDESDDCELEGGIGAWQVGVRYSWLDLDDKGINGSTCHDVTVGLNWFLNPRMKWQFNYSTLYRYAPNPANDGWVYGFGTRIAFDF